MSRSDSCKASQRKRARLRPKGWARVNLVKGRARKEVQTQQNDNRKAVRSAHPAHGGLTDRGVEAGQGPAALKFLTGHCSQLN